MVKMGFRGKVGFFLGDLMENLSIGSCQIKLLTECMLTLLKEESEDWRCLRESMLIIWLMLCLFTTSLFFYSLNYLIILFTLSEIITLLAV